MIYKSISIYILLNCLHGFQIQKNDETKLCSTQIIEQLQRQRVDFNEQFEEIIIFQQNLFILSLNLRDCQLEKTIQIQQQFKRVQIQDLILQNVQSNKTFLQIQNVQEFYINNIEFNKVFNQNSSLIRMENVNSIHPRMIQIGNLTFNNTSIKEIDFGVFINIEQLNFINTQNSTIKARERIEISICKNCDISLFQSNILMLNNCILKGQSISNGSKNADTLQIGFNSQSDQINFKVSNYKNVRIDFYVCNYNVNMEFTNIDSLIIQQYAGCIIDQTNSSNYQQYSQYIFKSQNCSQVLFQDLNFEIQSMIKFQILIEKSDQVQFQQFRLKSVAALDNVIYIKNSRQVKLESILIVYKSENNSQIIPANGNSIKRSLNNEESKQSFLYFEIDETKNIFQEVNIQISKVEAYFDHNQYQRFFDCVIQGYQQALDIFILQSKFHNIQNNLNGGCIRVITLSKPHINQKQNLRILSTVFDNIKSSGFGQVIFSDISLIINENVFSDFENHIDLIDNEAIFFSNKIDISLQNQRLTWQEWVIDGVFEFQEIDQFQKIQLKKVELKDGIYNIFPGVLYILSIKMDGEFYFPSKLYDNLYIYVDFKQSDFFPFLQVTKQDQIQKTPYLAFKINSNINKEYKIQFKFGYQLNLKVKSENCITGQQINKMYPLESQNFECSYCPYMYVSYEINEQCLSCSSFQFQYCYSNSSSLKKGFYRSNLTINQTEIYQCKFNKNACLGGISYGNQLCSEGNIGFECKMCDITGNVWNNRFGYNGYFQCAKCSEEYNNKILLTVVFIFYFFIALSATIGIIKNNELIIKKNYLSKMNLIYLGSSFLYLGQSSVYVKIFSFSYSMLQYIQSQVRFKILNLLALQTYNPSNNGHISLDCILIEIIQDGDSYLLIKFITYYTLPIIIILLIALILLFQSFIKKNSNYSNSMMVCTIFLMLVVFYNSFLSIILEIQVCKSFYGSQSNHCQEEHVVILTIISIIYCLGIPIFVLYKLILNKDKLQNIKFMIVYGFLYKEYKQKYFYWEFIRLSIRTIQVAVSKLLIFDLILMNSVNILILVFYLTFLLIAKPFQRRLVNQLELVTVIFSIWNFLSLIIFQRQDELTDDSDKMYPSEVILIISLYSTLLFQVVLLIMIIKSACGVILILLQNSHFFQRLFNYQCLKKRYMNTRRAVKNLMHLRKSILSQIEINRVNRQLYQSYNFFSSINEVQNLIPIQSVNQQEQSF